MNLLMLNPVHPDTPHISAVRAWRFAQELSALGHRVVLLTATGAIGAMSTAVDPNHDWRQPALLACASTAVPTGPRSGWTPRLLRRARTALRMLRDGGESGAWTKAAVLAGTQLPPAFAPDVVWATFGHLEAVFAARRIAHRLHVPWVLDLKDNWELYVPRGLRRLMVWRTRGFAAATANGCSTRDMLRKWHGAEGSLIYSGIEDCFFAPGDTAKPSHFDINLVGSIYRPEQLRAFLSGVARWYRQLPAEQQTRVRLRHIGAQAELVRNAAQATLPELEIALPGYLSSAEMARLCQGAAVNAYIFLFASFHHKLLELLACGRPVLAYPSESRESIELAASVQGQLLTPATPDEVAHTLARLAAAFFDGTRPMPGYPVEHARRYSWPSQAALLQQVLAETLTKP